MKALESIVHSFKISRLAIPLAALGIMATTALTTPAYAGNPGDEPDTKQKITDVKKDDCANCSTEQLFSWYKAKNWNKVTIPAISGTSRDSLGTILLTYENVREVPRLEESFLVPESGSFVLDRNQYMAQIAKEVKKDVRDLIDSKVVMRVRGDDKKWHYFNGPELRPREAGLTFGNYEYEALVFCTDTKGKHIVASIDGEVAVYPTVVFQKWAKISMVYRGDEPKEPPITPPTGPSHQMPCPEKPKEGPPAAYLFTAFAGGHSILPDGELDATSTIPSVIGPLRFIADKDMRSSGVSFEIASDRVYAEGKFTREVALGKDIFERNQKGEVVRTVKDGSLAENTVAGAFFYSVPLKETENFGGMKLVGTAGLDAAYITSTTGLRGASDIHIDRWDGALLGGLGVRTDWTGTPAVSFLVGPHAYTWGGDAGDADNGIEFQLRGRSTFGPALFDVVYKRAHFTEEANGYTGEQNEKDLDARGIFTVWNGLGILIEYDHHNTATRTDELKNEGKKNSSKGHTTKDQVRFGITYRF
ncbi:MAG: hypothetical protein ABIJ21_03405 [Nanoarchaeota archaeon]